MKPLRSTAPIGSILNKAFKYVPAAATNIQVTFDRLTKQHHTKDKEHGRLRKVA